MSACAECTNDARCQQLGLCQHVARQVLPGPEPEPEYDGWRTCLCNLEQTIEERDRRRCACCGGLLI